MCWMLIRNTNSYNFEVIGCIWTERMWELTIHEHTCVEMCRERGRESQWNVENWYNLIEVNRENCNCCLNWQNEYFIVSVRGVCSYRNFIHIKRIKFTLSFWLFLFNGVLHFQHCENEPEKVKRNELAKSKKGYVFHWIHNNIQPLPEVLELSVKWYRVLYLRSIIQKTKNKKFIEYSYNAQIQILSFSFFLSIERQNKRTLLPSETLRSGSTVIYKSATT
jgi:hypothetical protein